jgi:hypothetical protein
MEERNRKRSKKEQYGQWVSIFSRNPTAKKLLKQLRVLK